MDQIILGLHGTKLDIIYFFIKILQQSYGSTLLQMKRRYRKLSPFLKVSFLIDDRAMIWHQTPDSNLILHHMSHNYWIALRPSDTRQEALGSKGPVNT